MSPTSSHLWERDISAKREKSPRPVVSGPFEGYLTSGGESRRSLDTAYSDSIAMKKIDLNPGLWSVWSIEQPREIEMIPI